MEQRNLCPKCQTYRYTNPGEPCWHCKSPAEQRAILEAKHQQEATPAVSPAPITFGGHVVDAPGFSQDQFDRAMMRAFVDDLAVTWDATGQAIVTHRGRNGGYACSRERCTCKAGEAGTPCKHRAVLIAHLDAREPAIRRQWAEVRQAVA